jgi:hypothetical protein
MEQIIIIIIITITDDDNIELLFKAMTSALYPIITLSFFLSFFLLQYITDLLLLLLDYGSEGRAREREICSNSNNKKRKRTFLEIIIIIFFIGERGM